jgi:ABC-type Fe3+-hydroxamate transport system substrate-binding protein
MITDKIEDIRFIPKRIVSVVPSQTELLFDLGLEHEVLGITKFCIHPKDICKTKAIVGGTKNLNIEKIISLQPDLIIANKEENVKEQIELLSEKIPVWLTDVNDYHEALQMIADLGKITHTSEKANSIKQSIDELLSAPIFNKKRKAVYLIWKSPFMTIGGDTFIDSMMHKAGFENTFHHLTRYPEIEIENIAKSDCEFVLLSSEPYPFAQKHVDEMQALLPNKKIIIVDGEMFSWYGSRMLKSAAYFKELSTSFLNSD